MFRAPRITANGDRTTDFVLIATVRSVLLVSLKKRTVVPIEFHRPEYYGISWIPDHEDLVLTHSHLNNAQLVNIEHYATSETGTLSLGNLESVPFLSAPHQILCAPDKRIICTNTGRNAITVYDFTQPRSFQEQRLSAARWDRLSLENRCGDHLNSVFLNRDRLYVLAHGHDGGSRVAVLSYPDLEVLSLEKIKWGTGMHNIWHSPAQQLIACHTEEGALIDLNDGQVVWKAGSQVFVRGLAAADDVVLIGESQFAERANRSCTTSGLWVVERDSWKTLDYFCLGPFGAVHEVRILDTPDHAHHGHTFAGLPALLSRVPGHDLRRDRLHRASLVESDNRAWADYTQVLGVPKVVEDGGRESSETSLCIMTQTASANERTWQLNFAYQLNPNASCSHVSAIYYWGSGSDAKMVALLLQPAGDKASLSLWVNEGNRWQVNPDWTSIDLPIHGLATLTATEAKWCFAIDQQKIAELDPSQFYRQSGAFGIRFCGARVYPSPKPANPVAAFAVQAPMPVPIQASCSTAD